MRRQFLKFLGLSGLLLYFPRLPASSDSLILRKIPSTDESIPAVGMGTWQTFNVGRLRSMRDERCTVLEKFFELGGTLVDSSPMYGSSEEVLGYCLEKLGKKEHVFAATKVWTSDTKEGLEQFQNSLKLWGLPSIELEQVHNLVNLEAHLENLFQLKAEGKLKYVGITTSHSRRHADFETAMKRYPLDFVQFTYNLGNREAEKRLLPLAKEKKIAVIANRPYRGGRLIRRLQRMELPQWASEIHCKSWPDFLLKFIVSHPAVTCAIPATTKVEHMKENMLAGRGKLPSSEGRQRMIKYLKSI